MTAMRLSGEDTPTAGTHVVPVPEPLSDSSTKTRQRAASAQEARRALFRLHTMFIETWPSTRAKTLAREDVLLQWGHYTAVAFERESTLEQRQTFRKLWLEARAAQLQASREAVESPRAERGVYYGTLVEASNVVSAERANALVEQSVARGRALRQGTSPENTQSVSVVPVKPVKPLLDSEVKATNEVEFTALLRTIQIRSGLNPAQVAERASLPRSQAYSLVKRDKLPTKSEQVLAFITACGLPETQIRWVMALWAELRERRGSAAACSMLEQALANTWSASRTDTGHLRSLNSDKSLHSLSWTCSSPEKLLSARENAVTLEGMQALATFVYRLLDGRGDAEEKTCFMGPTLAG